jgi:chromosome segregation ATPase
MYEEEQYKASEDELEKTAELEEKNHRLSKELCSLKAKNRNLEGMMRRNRRVLESKMNKLEAETNTMVDADVVVDCKKKIKKLEGENADLCKKIEDLEDTIASMKKANDAIDAEANVEEILALKRAVEQLTAKNNRLRRALNESKAEKEEVKKTRFSTLKKEMDEDDEVIVDDELINDEVDNVVVDDGPLVVAEEADDSDDELLERMLRGEVK